MVEIPLTTGAQFVHELLAIQSSEDIAEVVFGSASSPVQLRKSITLIVGAIIIEGDEILMVHEAKPYCFQKWHLPSGKVKPGETLVECFRRELVEETLVEGIPDRILSVNLGIDKPDKIWLRFAFFGHSSGGSLKTAAQADRHSLEAKWLPLQDVLAQKYELRQPDILAPIQLAIEHQHSSILHQMILCVPVILPQAHLSIQVFLVCQDAANSRWMVLIHSQTKTFPQDIIRNACLDDLLQGLLSTSGYRGSFQVLGVLSVEHGPIESRSSDGLRINLACEAVVCGSLTGSANWEALDGRLCHALEIMKRTSSLAQIPCLCGKTLVCT